MSGRWFFVQQWISARRSWSCRAEALKLAFDGSLEWLDDEQLICITRGGGAVRAHLGGLDKARTRRATC